MDKGFLYYAWFPRIQVFKVGRTIQGLRRFQNADYLKFYREYNQSGLYSWVHMIQIPEHCRIESRIHRIYKESGFDKIPRKKEYYLVKESYDYALSRNIFLDVTMRYSGDGGAVKYLNDV